MANEAEQHVKEQPIVRGILSEEEQRGMDEMHNRIMDECLEQSARVIAHRPKEEQFDPVNSQIGSSIQFCYEFSNAQTRQFMNNFKAIEGKSK